MTDPFEALKKQPLAWTPARTDALVLKVTSAILCELAWWTWAIVVGVAAALPFVLYAFVRSYV
jgi:hypothetical protein